MPSVINTLQLSNAVCYKCFPWTFLITNLTI